MPSEEIIAMPNFLITYHEGGMEVESCGDKAPLRDHPGRGWPGSLQAYGACDMSDNLLVAGWPDDDSRP
jgi:hypothetical protein